MSANNNLPRCYECELQSIYELADGGYGCGTHNFVCMECNQRLMIANRDKPNIDVCYGCKTGKTEDRLSCCKTVGKSDSKEEDPT